MINWFEKHHAISWVITIFGAIAIFYISSLTFEGSGAGGKSIIPTIYHLFAFFFFSFFLLMALVKGKNRRLILLGLIIAVIYSMFDEIHQIYVPGRYGSFSDFLLNGVGIVFALMIYSISILYREKTADR